MAPGKSTRLVSKQKSAVLPMTRKGLEKAVQNAQDQNVENMPVKGKRKAEHSPLKNDKIKRSALGNLTNNLNSVNFDEEVKRVNREKIASTSKKISKSSKSVATYRENKDLNNAEPMPYYQPTKMVTRSSAKFVSNGHVQVDNQANSTILSVPGTQTEQLEPTVVKKDEAKGKSAAKTTQKSTVRRISDEFNKTEESLYMSALEDISNSDSMRLSINMKEARRSALRSKLKKDADAENTPPTKEKYNHSDLLPPPDPVPEGVEDFDKATQHDPFQVATYAMDVFNYLKQRERDFYIGDYMSKQVHLTKWMRSLLVDWMVEVQETFELNHETLYLGVKIVDIFLCKAVINKDKLQLLGAAAIFIACKFDERTPPLLDDFLYICDGAYKHKEIIKMEMTTLKTINYDLGIPLSYRFLRRYARCGKVPIDILTLARYILELSLMDYDVVSFSDSKMAAAVLFMALRMTGTRDAWTPTLQYYTGYKLDDFAGIVPLLNAGLHRKPKGTTKTIRSKYSHKVFHEAAKVPLMSTETLFEYANLCNTSVEDDHQ